MIKYAASTTINTIKPVEVERETDSSVWINGRRASKRGGFESYFDTWEDARSFLLRNAEDRVNSARRHLECEKSKLGNIKGMKEPK